MKNTFNGHSYNSFDPLCVVDFDDWNSRMRKKKSSKQFVFQFIIHFANEKFRMNILSFLIIQWSQSQLSMLLSLRFIGSVELMLLSVVEHFASRENRFSQFTASLNNSSTQFPSFLLADHVVY